MPVWWGKNEILHLVSFLSQHNNHSYERTILEFTVEQNMKWLEVQC